jgi:hypothetical protein
VILLVPQISTDFTFTTFPPIHTSSGA